MTCRCWEIFQEKLTNLQGKFTIPLKQLTPINLYPQWENPITVKPDLEPTFSAAMHGVELGFILCAEFISDSRYYVVKRPRVELIAEDIIKQIGLVSFCASGMGMGMGVSSW